MIEVNIHEAKTHLSSLITRAATGEEVIISRYGKPTAKLVPFSATSKKRRGGRDRGSFQVPDDFDKELPELNRLFEA